MKKCVRVLSLCEYSEGNDVRRKWRMKPGIKELVPSEVSLRIARTIKQFYQVKLMIRGLGAPGSRPILKL